MVEYKHEEKSIEKQLGLSEQEEDLVLMKLIKLRRLKTSQTSKLIEAIEEDDHLKLRHKLLLVYMMGKSDGTCNHGRGMPEGLGDLLDHVKGSSSVKVIKSPEDLKEVFKDIERAMDDADKDDK